MMKEMWGENTTRAYLWILENTGEDVHFSNIDGLLLRKVHKALHKRMFAKGFRKPKRTEEIQTLALLARHGGIKKQEK